MLRKYQIYIKYFTHICHDRFLIFTDIPYIQIIQYFFPIKKILYILKKKLANTESHSHIRNIDSNFRAKFAKFTGSEKRIEWKINKKSREAIENCFSKKKKKKTTEFRKV